MVDEIDIMKFLCCLYVINMMIFLWLYLYTMYTQYKNAHDKWYDIIRENDTDDIGRIENTERIKRK